MHAPPPDGVALSDISELLAGSSKATIAELCGKLNVSAEGSRRDMLVRLKDVISLRTDRQQIR